MPMPDAPCPTAQQLGRHAAALVLRRKPTQALDPDTIRRAHRDDANVYPVARRCFGDWLTGYYAGLQGMR